METKTEQYISKCLSNRKCSQSYVKNILHIRFQFNWCNQLCSIVNYSSEYFRSTRGIQFIRWPHSHEFKWKMIRMHFFWKVYFLYQRRNRGSWSKRNRLFDFLFNSNSKRAFFLSNKKNLSQVFCTLYNQWQWLKFSIAVNTDNWIYKTLYNANWFPKCPYITVTSVCDFSCSYRLLLS